MASDKDQQHRPQGLQPSAETETPTETPTTSRGWLSAFLGFEWERREGDRHERFGFRLNLGLTILASTGGLIALARLWGG